MKNGCAIKILSKLSNAVLYCGNIKPEVITLQLIEDGIYVSILYDEKIGRHTDIYTILYLDLLKSEKGWLRELKEHIDGFLDRSRKRKEQAK